MRQNSRVRQRSGRSPGALRAMALLAAGLALLGGAFVAGVSVGRKAAPAPADTPVATRAALEHLDHLDDPPPPARDEGVPELKAPQVLTDARPLERTLPLAPAKLVPAPTPTPNATAASTSTSTAKTVAKPAAKPPPPAAAPPAGAYAIQVASSPNRADAERLAARLGGREARVVTADVPGKGRVYRVQVGAFATPEAARKQLPRLARAGLDGFVVTAAR